MDPADHDRAIDRWADATRVAALLAIDPDLGGVVLRARSGPVREAWLDLFRRLLEPNASWRRLPPGAGDAALIGGLDLAAALGGRGRRMQAGLLAQSDGGVLLAPMAERIEAGVAARLASALDGGRVKPHGCVGRWFSRAGLYSRQRRGARDFDGLGDCSRADIVNSRTQPLHHFPANDFRDSRPRCWNEKIFNAGFVEKYYCNSRIP